MIVFKPSKMLDVPLSRGRIDPEAVRREFWPGVSPLGEKAGCYIFAVPQKYGRDGLLPIYVGRAARPLMQECFTSEKIMKLNNYLLHHPSASLSLLLLIHPPNRHGLNRTAISDLEKSLIKMAVSVNPNLINKKNTRPDCWALPGSFAAGEAGNPQGPSNSERFSTWTVKARSARPVSGQRRATTTLRIRPTPASNTIQQTAACDIHGCCRQHWADELSHTTEESEMRHGLRELPQGH